MTDTFLLAVDGSEPAGRAAEFAKSRAGAEEARLVVAYVIEWSPYTFNPPEENEERHKRREEEIARARSQVLDPLVAALQDEGLEIEGVVRHGNVAEVLSDLAVEKGACQIFIGRRGQSTVKAMLFGSVAGTLVQVSPVPVTVVP